MKNIFLALIGLGIIGTCALYGAPANSTLMEVWTGGDDGLTQQLRDAVERKFKAPLISFRTAGRSRER